MKIIKTIGIVLSAPAIMISIVYIFRFYQWLCYVWLFKDKGTSVDMFSILGVLVTLGAMALAFCYYFEIE